MNDRVKGSGNESKDEINLREDEKTDTHWGTNEQHGHAVTNEDGNVEYLRDKDGTVYVDDKRGINNLKDDK